MRTGTVEQMGPPALQVYRVNGNLNLSRAIGDLTYKKDKTRQPHEQIICSTPDFMMEDRHADDEFVFLACDGVYLHFSHFYLFLPDLFKQCLPTSFDIQISIVSFMTP